MTASDSRGPDPHPHGLDAEVQRELAEAMGDENPEELMEQSVAPPKPQDPAETPGDAEPEEPLHLEMRRGRIAAIRGEDVFVDLAGETSKLQGVVPLAQFDRPPRLGSIMDFVVDHADEGQGLMFLSREGAITRSTWDQLHRGLAVEARVVSTNKGGLEMEMVGGIRAFMPASQIDLHHVDDLEALVGQKLEGQVQEIDRKSKKVVLSRRHLLEQRRAAAREKLLAELKAGQVREGVVSNIVAFGAFVDLGGLDGLLHVSDMSYGHIDKPGDVVKKGQKLQVMVLKVEDGGNRISLGLKQTEPDPWEAFLTQARVGSQVEGRVTRTANFGAFVEVAPGVEGLLPISEMSWKRVHNAEEVVKVGDHIRLSIISLEPEKRRMSLSLKQAQGDPWMGVERRFEKGATVPGTVRSTTEFGAFVELAPGIEGLVHISELADRRVGSVEDVVKPGDVKDFRVLDVNEEQRKISLSLRPPREGGQGRGEHGKHHAPPPKAAPRKPRTDLKGGMDAGGIGLGKLRLEDLQ